MTEEELRECIRNYRLNSSELKRLKESIDDSIHDFLEVGYSSREERVYRRFEVIERKVSILDKAIDYSNLTDKEWTMVDCVIEGMSVREVGRDIFCCSHSTAAKVYSSAVNKMLEFLNCDQEGFYDAERCEGSNTKLLFLS